MEKEALIKLKEKISRLDKSDLAKRNEYLKGLLDGKVQGPLTGDVFVDKPWLNRYSNSFNINVNDSVYNNFCNAIKGRLDEICAYDFKSKRAYTNGEVLDLVEKASAGFLRFGIKEGSKVGVLLNGTIEEIVTYIALAKIGAKKKYIDYMKSPSSIKHNIEEEKLDLFVMDNMIAKQLGQIAIENNKKIIVADGDSEYNDGFHYSFSQLYELGKDKDALPVPYDKDRITLTINSSGTTGDPKPINHTDFSVNNAVLKMLKTHYNLQPGNVITKVIPSQIGLGLITSLYTGLVSGSQVVLIGGSSVDGLINSLKAFVTDFNNYKKKYNLKDDATLTIIAAPKFFRDLINAEDVTDLSFVGGMLAAGSKMDAKELDDLEKIASSKGYNHHICNGYGQNEMAGAVTLNTNKYNLNGSAGFPTYQTEIAIVDRKTNEYLTNNEEGIILEKSDSKFKYYENLPEVTKKATIKLADGSEWFNTNDVGYFDDNGYLHVTGRTTRVVTRYDFKFSLDYLESKLRRIDKIHDCASFITRFGGSVEDFVVFVEPSSENETESTIMEAISNSEELVEYEVPSDIIVVDKIPYKDNGKIDYELLKEEYFNNYKKTLKK